MNQIIRKLSIISSLVVSVLLASPVRAENVRIEDLPQPVRATIEKESKGQQLLEMERETENGQTVFEASWKEGNKKIELTVDMQGKVIEREEKSV